MEKLFVENNIKENTKSYPFVIEYNTNYSVVLKGIRRMLSFEVIRKISNDLSYIYLSDSIKQDLHNTIMHGECMLSNLLELNAYMYDMGKMHNAKLRYACEHISENFKATNHIDIIDYGCGLGIGIISYADFLREKHLQQNVRRIVLIEPSYVALCRAAIHARLLFPNAQIITINKKFDELEIGDLYRDSNISVLHIFSNILDIGNYDGSNSYFGYDLKNLATIVRESLKGNNEFLCIAPYYEYNFKDNKIPFFIENLGINVHYKFIRGKGEFVNGKNWTCAIYVGSINNGIDDDTELIKIRSVEDEENVTQSISGNEELSPNVFETLTLNQFKERFKTDKIQIVRQSNNDLAFSCNGHKGCLTSNIKENIINNQPIGEVYFSYIEEKDFLGWVLHEKGNPSLIEYSKFCTIYFNPNGSIGEMPSIKIRSNSDYVLPTSSFILDGCIFKAWNTKADGTGVFYNVNDSIKVTTDIILFAQWEKEEPTYTIFFHANGGVGEILSIETVNNSIKILPLNPFIRNGYKFISWNTEPKGLGLSLKENATIYVDKEIHFYAQWCRISNDNYEYVDLGLPSGVLWAKCNVGATRPEDIGEYYTGDYLNKEKKDIISHLPTIEMQKELRKECDWELKVINGNVGLNITSRKNNNSIFLPASGLYRSGDVYGKFISGYYWCRVKANKFAYMHIYTKQTAVSWHDSGFLFGRTIRLIDYKKYIIIFDSNGGCGFMNNMVVVKNQYIKLDQNTFIRDRFIFVEWNTKPDGGGYKYRNQEIILLRSDIILYAQWRHLRNGELLKYYLIKFKGKLFKTIKKLICFFS